MRVSTIILLMLCLSGNTFISGQSTGDKGTREPAVSGSFYPADEQSLKAQLLVFFNQVKDKATEQNIAAIIVPHAGYVFSGGVAASAYAKIDPDKQYSRIFVLGTSHHALLNGASVYNRGDYKTPLGTVTVDTELANKLIKENRLITYTPEAHEEEHSIEVQLPFLQYHLRHSFKLVPLVVGTQSAETCRELAEILKPYFTPENLFVISSDFSHYPAYKDAIRYDTELGQTISNNSPEEFILSMVATRNKQIPGLATSCCGWSSVLTLLDITSEYNNIEAKHIAYMNSGDTPFGDKQKVVGYHAFIFTRDETKSSSFTFTLNPDEKIMLLKIAREAIDARLANRELPAINENKISENLTTECGAFVTLMMHAQLRGCIGRFMANEPLYKVVQDMALAAAFQDRRFSPVTKNEMKNIDIEISVLTPLKKIYSIDDFHLGEQGIYIIKGNRSGTFLPQVEASTGWTKEEFLGHCAQDKAGIGWDGWKDADLFTYEALVFDEGELLSEKK